MKDSIFSFLCGDFFLVSLIEPIGPEILAVPYY